MFRFAPSPTGFMHIGNARPAVLNYILAKIHNAELILRFDDTGTSRSSEIYIDAIEEDLAWLGLKFDRQYRQSERKYPLEALKAAGYLYPCYETSEELELQRQMQLAASRPPRYQQIHTDTSRTPHWRFKLQGTHEIWNDLIIGPQNHNSVEYSDPVVVREDGVVLYTLASVMDDVADNISWIVRGKDHVSNTVVQRQIFRALGRDPDLITWAHIPLFVDTDGKPLSKRRGTSSISHLRYQGYSPWSVVCALCNAGKKSLLQYAPSFEELIACNEFVYARNSAVWNNNACDYWERKKTVSQGLEFIAQNGWERASDKQWELLKEELRSRKDIVYWREICTNTKMYFIPLSRRESQIRADALKFDTWDVTKLSEITGYSKRDVGMSLRYALTGLVDGPQIHDLVQCVPAEILRARCT